MRPHLLALIMIAAIVIVACAPAQTAQAPEPQKIGETGPSAAAAQPEDTPLLRRENADIRAMVDKQTGVKSITFDVATLPDMGAWATYYVRGDKALVEPASPIAMSGWSADTVYVDFTAKTAEARCVKFSGCKNDHRAATVDFARYDIELPTQWGDRVVYGERTGGVTFNSRQVTVVRWEEDGKTFEAYIDPFYGVVHRVAVLDLSTDPPTIKGGYEYRDIVYNTVKAEDVVAS